MWTEFFLSKILTQQQAAIPDSERSEICLWYIYKKKELEKKQKNTQKE